MKGNVFWITGLSGAGKTTIGKLLYSELKDKMPIVLLDGDALRKIYGEVNSYTEADRKRIAMMNARLCKHLADQGINVICCTISMFDSVRAWNAENIEKYIEVYLKVSIATLIRRDQKGLYTGIQKGIVKNVAGIDLKFEEPKNPSMVIDNNGENTPMQIVQEIINKWRE